LKHPHFCDCDPCLNGIGWPKRVEPIPEPEPAKEEVHEPTFWGGSITFAEELSWVGRWR